MVKMETSSGKPKKDIHQEANKAINRSICNIPKQTFFYVVFNCVYLI